MRCELHGGETCALVLMLRMVHWERYGGPSLVRCHSGSAWNGCLLLSTSAPLQEVSGWSVLRNRHSSW